jgi:hypothetical protein
MLPPIGLLLATASAHVLPGHPQAIVVTDNLQATYVADLKKDPRDTVAGTVVVSPTKDHVGVGITVRITGLRPTGSYCTSAPCLGSGDFAANLASKTQH